MPPKADSIEIAIQNASAAIDADPTLKGTDAAKQYNAIYNRLIARPSLNPIPVEIRFRNRTVICYYYALRVHVELRRRRVIMFGFQKDLAAYAKTHCSLSGVWYNVDSSKSGEDKCLAHTLEWIQEMVATGDLPFEGENDPRVQDCVLLSRL